jgi:hypothetical protein
MLVAIDPSKATTPTSTMLVAIRLLKAMTATMTSTMLVAILMTTVT